VSFQKAITEDMHYLRATRLKHAGNENGPVVIYSNSSVVAPANVGTAVPGYRYLVGAPASYS
jgi:hypothetical protein